MLTLCLLFVLITVGFAQENPTGGPATPGQPGVPKPVSYKDAIKTQNDERAFWNLPAFTWDTNLAKVAQEQANKCQFTSAGFAALGQSYATLNGKTYDGSIDQSVGQLYAMGIPQFDIPASLTPLNYREAWHCLTNTCGGNGSTITDCKLYTQIVWQKTTKMGCAVANCDKNSPVNWASNWDLLFCLYNQAGNYEGQHAFGSDIDARTKRCNHVVDPPPPRSVAAPVAAPTVAPAFTAPVAPSLGPGTSMGITRGSVMDWQSSERAFWKVPAFTWSDQLASIAQDFANNCTWTSSSAVLNTLGTMYAQARGVQYNPGAIDQRVSLNVAGGFLPGDIPNAQVTWDARAKWDCNNDQACTSGCASYRGVIWLSSSLIGCAQSSCPATTNNPAAPGQPWTLLACLYNPAGKQVGVHPFGVNPAPFCAGAGTPPPVAPPVVPPVAPPPVALPVEPPTVPPVAPPPTDGNMPPPPANTPAPGGSGNLPPPSVPGIGTPIAFSTSQILDEHNVERAYWTVPLVSWDIDLARVAQDVANKCEWTFPSDWSDDRSKRLATYKGYSFDGSRPQRVGEGHNLGVATFKDDRPFWRCDVDTCTDGDCTAYKQMVWLSTTIIGCGVSSCSNDVGLPDKPWTYLVCLYNEAGIYPGEHPFGANKTKYCNRQGPPSQVVSPPPLIASLSSGKPPVAIPSAAASTTGSDPNVPPPSASPSASTTGSGVTGAPSGGSTPPPSSGSTPPPPSGSPPPSTGSPPPPQNGPPGSFVPSSGVPVAPAPPTAPSSPDSPDAPGAPGAPGSPTDESNSGGGGGLPVWAIIVIVVCVVLAIVLLIAAVAYFLFFKPTPQEERF